MNDEMIKVSLFANLQSHGSKAVGMEEIVRLVQYDDIMRQKTETYQHMARTISREEANKRVKRGHMEACSVAVLYDGYGRQPEHVLHFTGLGMCDMDHIAGERMAEVRSCIEADEHTLLCYRTISGEGLRILFRYVTEVPREQPDGVPYRAAFLAGNSYYAKLTGWDYDAQCADYGRLCGLAHDEAVHYNPQAKPFVVTDEMVLEANFSQESTTNQGKPRQVMPTGTVRQTAEAAWPRVEKMLGQRMMHYEPHHHHDFVLHACYLFNRFGVPEDELTQWAERQWGDMEGRERNGLIRHCYSRQEEHGTWQLTRERHSRHENTMITIAEIRQWLDEHVELIYNVVTDQTMLRLKVQENTRDTVPWTVVDERVLASLRARMAVETDKRVLKNDVYDVIKSDYARMVHPVRDYVEALPPWDGTDRVGQLGCMVETEDGTTWEWALHKWLTATVATWMYDTAANHEVLTLIGPQGIYKTTFFRHLLPEELRPYFWENGHNSFGSKDDHLALAENCLVEIEEVDTAAPRDLSELKALVTSITVKERRPYARFREEKHRLASFCATGNQQHFLSDDTGSRRWLCFMVSHIRDPRQWRLDYEQLYAQLRDEVRGGYAYWFSAEDQLRVEELNAPFRIESDEEQLIRTRLRPPRPQDPVKLMNAAGICQLLNGGHVGFPLSSRKVCTAMRKMGFPARHTRGGTFFCVYEVPLDQIQPQLAMETYVPPSDGMDGKDAHPPETQTLPF